MCDDYVFKQLSHNMVISGKSVGAKCTLVRLNIKGTNILFDVGKPDNVKANVIALSHTHLDHCYGIGMTLKYIVDGVDVYVPESYVGRIKALIDATYLLKVKDNDSDKVQYRHKIRPAIVGQEILVVANKEADTLLRVYQSYHGDIDAVSYGVINRKKTYNQSENIYMFFYSGDTTIKLLENEEIFQYKFIMIECTFLYNEDEEETNVKPHIHWKQLQPFIEKYQDQTFILFHFCAKYEKHKIQQFFVDKPMKNIILFI